MSIALKQVYRQGFSYNAGQDVNPIIPAIIDVTNNSSQMPSGHPSTDFVIWDEDIYIPESISNGSARFMLDITKPTSTSSTTTGRVEHMTRYPHLTESEDTWYSMSYRFSADSIADPLEEIIYQNHFGTGTPSFHIRRVNERLCFYIYMASGFANQMIFDVGPATNETWHHFIFRIKHRDNEDGILTVWKDGSLARLHNPLTGDPWIIPTEPVGGIPLNYISKSSMGYIAKTVVENGQEVSVLDWRGVTTRMYPNPNKYDKWGFYKSAWSDRYDGNGDLLPDVYNPESPLYVEPGNRNKTLWISNLKFDLYGRNSHDNTLKSLSPFNVLPDEFPDWYDPDLPINIITPLNNSEFSVGQNVKITTDISSGPVELVINNNLIEEIHSDPYEFNVLAGSIDINDSSLNLKFNGDSVDFSSETNIINIVNPSDSLYVDGARGQAISLGNSPNNNEKSYIEIIPSEKLKNISNRFTISFWIKGEPIFHRLFANNMNGVGLYFQTISDGRIDFFIRDSNPLLNEYRLRSSSIDSTGKLDINTWHHFAWTFDGSFLRCYYDFMLSNSLEIEDDLDFSTDSIWLINKKHDSNIPGSASYDDFRIYDYAIPEEEINKTVEDNFLGQLEIKVRKSGIESDPVTINIVEELPTFTISATATTGGNVSGDGEYEENEEVTLTATPDSGYEFVRWEEDSETVSTANPYIFNAEEDRTLLAVFQQIEYQLTVTYTAGGTATGSGEYTEGEQVELTATPNSGYSFVGWYRDSTLLSTDNPYNYTTRGQSDTVQARFELIPIPEFTITVIPSTGGTVSGGGVYEEGQAVTLSAMPQSGWTFIKWSNEATANPYSFNASENLTISAIFEEVNPEVPYIIVKGKFKIV